MCPAIVRSVPERLLRMVRARLEHGGKDGGFILLEAMVAIMIVTVVMAAVTVEFVSNVAASAMMRNQQGAIQLANSTVETIRAMRASDLVTGRDANTVKAQYDAAPTSVTPWLLSLGDQATDATAAAGTGGGAAVPTTATVQTPAKVSYSVNEYLQKCSVPTAGSLGCVAPSAIGTAPATGYLQAVVAVTWPTGNCGATQCRYVTSTIISAASDPTFRLNSPPYATPVIIDPGPQSNTVNQSVSLQLQLQAGTGVPTFTWTVTSGSLPGSLSMSSSGLISGSVGNSPGSYSTTIQVQDQFQRTSTRTINWTVYPTAGATGLGAKNVTVGAGYTGANSTAITYTCPRTTCTITLANPVPGIGLSATSTGTPTASLTVTSASGTVYVTGTVTNAAVPTGSSKAWAQSLSLNDGSNTTTTSATWTAYLAPTLATLANRSVYVGASDSVGVLYTCPNTTCTVRLSGSVPGLGLSSTANVSSDNSTGTSVAVTATTGIIYLTGVVQAGAVTSGNTWNPSITITDGGAYTSVASSATYTAYVAPTVTSPGNQVSTAGVQVSTQLTTTCANTACTYTFNGAAPSGLTISSTGLITGPIGAAATYSGITVTVTDAAGVTATTAAFSWAVYARPSAPGLAARNVTVGAGYAGADSTAITYSCSRVNCTITLANPVPGIGLSTTSTGTPAASLTVTATSGTVYVTGAVTSAAVPTGSSKTWAQSLSITDGGNITTSADATWTAYLAPTLAALPGRSVTVGATDNAGLIYTCPNTTCTLTLSGSAPGLGLSSTASQSSDKTNATSLTVTATTGTVYLTGLVQPTAANAASSKTWTPSIQITDGGTYTSAPSTATYTAYPAPTVTSPGNQTTTAGAQVSTQLATSCLNSPCSYAFTGSAAPSGLTISSTGLIAGTIGATTGAFTGITVRVTDAAGGTATTAAFSWTVYAAPTVTSPGNQTSTAGTLVSTQLATSCPNTTCSYAFTGSAAPSGLTISSTGLIAGTIGATTGAFTGITVRVTDAAGVTATTAAFTWTVYAAPTVTSPGNQTTTAGAQVSTQLATSCLNGPCSYAFTGGTAPSGLTISSTGLISGTIGATTGAFTGITVRVTDAAGGTATTAAFTWTVKIGPSVTSPGNQVSYAGAQVSAPLTTSCPNSPCIYAFTGSAAPSGLTISGTGLISGAIGATTGAFTGITVRVTDAAGVTATTAAFSWTVYAQPAATGLADRNVTVSASYSTAITYSCSRVNCTITLANPVPGIGLSTTSTGTPAASLTVTATSGTVYVTGAVTSAAVPTGSSKTWAQSLSITDGGNITTSADATWTAYLAPTLAALPGRSVTVGATDNAGLIYTCPNTTCTLTLSGSAPGLGLSSTASQSSDKTNATSLTVTATTGTVYLTGLVQPTAANAASSKTWTPSIQITDGGTYTSAPSTATYTAYPAPTVTSPGNQTTTAGAQVSTQLATSCLNSPCSYAFTGSAAPSGLTISSTGLIAGTIGATTGAFTGITVRVTDAAGGTATTAAFSWTVYAAPTVTSPGNQTSTAGTLVSTQLATSCPNTTCSYAFTGSAAPSGLTISSTGLISGTIGATTGAFTGITVRVTDAAGVTATTAAFTWTVYAAPTATGLAAKNVTVGAGYTGSASTTITYSCPRVNCTITLANPVPGIGLSTTSTGTPAASLTVTATSGTVYVTGAVTSAAVPTGSSKTWAQSLSITDGGNITTSTNATWTAYLASTVTSPGNQTTTAGAQVSTQLTTSCLNSPCSYAFTGSAAPSGLTISNTGLISGTIGATTGAFTGITVRVTDAAGVTATSAAFSWTVYAAPAVTSPGNQTTTAGALVSKQLTTSCPNTTCSYAFTGSAAPSGLTVSSTGLISGTIGATTGAFTGITVRVTDAAGVTATTAAFTWTVNAVPTMSRPANQTTLRGRAVSVDESGLVNGGTGPYTYAATGLPSWLSINASTGVVTGTAPATNSQTTGITIRVTDASGISATSPSFTWYVTNLANSFGTLTTSDNTTINIDLDNYTTGGTSAYTYAASNLPSWVTLNSTTGVLSGTAPNLTNASTATANVTISVTDSTGATIAANPFTWYVTDLTWAIPNPISQPVGTNFTGQSAASYLSGGPSGSRLYSVTGLPTGLTMNTSGVLNGSVTTRGTWTPTFTVTDSVGATVSTTITFQVT